MLDSVFISLDNLRLFGSLIKSSLDEKLSTKDISEWALQKSKPDYDASEIFMVGNPAIGKTIAMDEDGVISIV